MAEPTETPVPPYGLAEVYNYGKDGVTVTFDLLRLGVVIGRIYDHAQAVRIVRLLNKEAGYV